MNDTFNFARFRKYYAGDFRNTLNNVWLTVLILSFAGIIAYLFCGLMSYSFDGHWEPYGLQGRVMVFLLAFYIMLMSLPSKAYGYFTDKRQGEFFSMIPASALEKTLSMVINLVVIAPIVYLVIALSADALICAVDPRSDGVSIVGFVSGLNSDINDDPGLFVRGTEFMVTSTIGFVESIISWVLEFLLGALYFKKNKIGKTILMLIVFNMMTSAAFIPLAINFGDGMLNTIDNSEKYNVVLWFCLAINAIVDIALLYWTYYRVRNVKR